MPNEKSIDIDNKEDFEIAKYLIKKMNALIIGLGSIGLGSKNLKIFKVTQIFFINQKI